jgi:hypothetical protein
MFSRIPLRSPIATSSFPRHDFHHQTGFGLPGDPIVDNGNLPDFHVLKVRAMEDPEGDTLHTVFPTGPETQCHLVSLNFESTLNVPEGREGIFSTETWCMVLG